MSLNEVWGSASPGPSNPETRAPGCRDACVALIDDDYDMCCLLARRLNQAGYRCVCYPDAESALASMEQEPPDLILLDLLLPGMDGWQFRLAQKRNAHLADVPVIALSGDASPCAAAIDAAAYLTKPVEFERLRSVMEHVLLSHARKRLVAKGVELERLRSLGMLVASVAHEVNNPLTFVSNHLERALRACDGAEGAATRLSDQLTPLIERAHDGVQRIAFVVQLLSIFGEGEHRRNSVVDPLRALDAATRLAAHHLDRRAHLVAHIEPVPFVHLNEGRLAQVLLNLLVNAAQAIPEGDPDHNEVRVRVSHQPPHVQIEIADTGCGIAPEVLSHIFEPFYTTKPAGIGTGLGLAISRDIVRQMGGAISVTSEPGHGATFRVLLPTHTAAQRLQGAPAQAE